jgi:hypothetical protein
MAKLAPKKYGDSVALTGGGERPLAIRWLSHEEAPKELE